MLSPTEAIASKNAFEQKLCGYVLIEIAIDSVKFWQRRVFLDNCTDLLPTHESKL